MTTPETTPMTMAMNEGSSKMLADTSAVEESVCQVALTSGIKSEKNGEKMDLARAIEAMENPAVGVITNPDLMRYIGEFIPKPSIERMTHIELDIFFDALGVLSEVEIGKVFVIREVRKSELPSETLCDFSKMNMIMEHCLNTKDFAVFIYHSGGCGARQSIRIKSHWIGKKGTRGQQEKWLAIYANKIEGKRKMGKAKYIDGARLLSEKKIAKKKSLKSDEKTRLIEVWKSKIRNWEQFTDKQLILAIKTVLKKNNRKLTGYTKWAGENPLYIIRQLYDIYSDKKSILRDIMVEGRKTIEEQKKGVL
jgi:hypothetical protein